jgi:hypothetical protein
MAQTVEDFFAGGIAAAKFEDGAFGSVIGGEIIDEPRMTQQRDYTSGEAITYPDGNPAMQMVVAVQAYPPNGDDDGGRAFYIKGQMKQAVGEALRKHGAKTLSRGGRLWVKYVEDKPTTLKNGRPGNPQKIYAAKYEPPAQAASGQFFDESPASAPAAAVPAQAPTTEFGLACPPGVEPGKWAAMTPVQRGQMYAALGLTAEAAPPRQAQARGFADEPPF